MHGMHVPLAGAAYPRDHAMWGARESGTQEILFIYTCIYNRLFGRASRGRTFISGFWDFDSVQSRSPQANDPQSI